MKRDRMLLVAILGLLGGCVNPSDPPQPDATGAHAGESAGSLPFDPPLTQQERTSFLGIHRNAVQQFASLPRFGGERMIRFEPIDDAIVPPSPSEADTAAKPARSPRALAQKPGQPPQDIHHPFRELLSYSTANFQGETWKLKELQLVGLIVHPNPVVYETEKVPGMKEVAELPTRGLSSFEKRALATLKNGEALKVEQDGATVRMMAPIFAGKKCLSCHEQPGQMLGAFSYVLERTPKTGPGSEVAIP